MDTAEWDLAVLAALPAHGNLEVLCGSTHPAADGTAASPNNRSNRRFPASLSNHATARKDSKFQNRRKTSSKRWASAATFDGVILQFVRGS